MRFGREIVVLFALSLVGCTLAPRAAPELDRTAKTFTPVADKCLLYVYRDTAFAAPFGLDLLLDGKFAGVAGAFSYYLWTVEPGSHQILARSENTAALPVKVATRNWMARLVRAVE